MSILILYFPCAALRFLVGFLKLVLYELKIPFVILAEGIFCLSCYFFFAFEPVFPFLVFPYHQYGSGVENGRIGSTENTHQ